MQQTPTNFSADEENILIFGTKDISVVKSSLESRGLYSNCTCDSYWDSPCYIFECKTCQLKSNACFCVNCFLNGQHDGHNFFLRPVEMYKCDCGDPNFVKEGGTCSKHSKWLDPSSYPADTFIMPYSDFCRKIKHFVDALTLSIESDQELSKSIVIWLASLCSLGDVAKCAISSSISLDILSVFFSKWGKLGKPLLLELSSLFMCLLSVEVFRKNSLPSLLNSLSQFSIDLSNHSMSPLNLGYALKLMTPQNFSDTPNPLLLLRSLSSILKSVISFPKTTFSEDDTFLTAGLIFSISSFFKFTLPKMCDTKELRQALTEYAANFLIKEFEYVHQREISAKSDAYDVNLEYHDFLIDHASSPIFLPTTPAPCSELLLHCLFDSLDLMFTANTFDKTTISNDIIFFHRLTFHNICFHSFVKEGGDLKQRWIKICGADKADFRALQCMVCPIRLFSVCYGVTEGLFNKNSNQEIRAIKECYRYPTSFQRLFHLTETCQTILRLISDKAAFLRMSMGIFGLFASKSQWNLTDEEISEIQFSFFHFIASLLYDSDPYTSSKESYLRSLTIAHLSSRPMTMENFCVSFSPNICHNTTWLEILNSVSSKGKRLDSILYRLSPNVKVDVLKTWIPIPEIKKIISKFSTSDLKLCFPEFRDVTNNSVFPSLIFFFLFFAAASETVSMVISMISSSIELPIEESSITFAASDFDDLCAHYPPSMSQSLNIKVSFRSSQPTSILDLVKSFGKLAEPILIRLGLSSPEKVNSKSSIDSLKSSILLEYKKRSEDFLSRNSDHISDTYFCSVCQSMKVEPLFLPTSFVTSALFGSTFPQLSFCNHQIHRSCAIKLEHYYVCPLDRLIRSSFLPCFMPGFLSQPSYESKDYCLEFSHSIRAGGNLAQCIDGFVSLLELRLRNNPEAADSVRDSRFLYNLFCCLFVVSHFEDMKCDGFGAFALALSKKANPKAEFMQEAKRYLCGGTCEEYKKVEIFRILSIEESGSADWDEDLSEEKLKAFYGTTELRRAPEQKVIIDLPKKFFDFARRGLPIYDPINFNVRFSICLFSGELVASRKVRGIKTIYEQMAERCASAYGVYLSLTGHDATAVTVMMPKFSSSLVIGSPYIDRNGDCDISHQRGEEMFLSDDRMEQIVERILSGSFLNISNE